MTTSTRGIVFILTLILSVGLLTPPAEAQAKSVPLKGTLQRPSVVQSDKAYQMDNALPVKTKHRTKQIPIIVSKNERSVKPSRYTGRFYKPRWESVRRCIVWRESNDKPGVFQGGYTSASGLYQFILSTWRSMTKYNEPAAHYSRKIQDRIFWKVWNNGKGKYHWKYGARYPCF